MAARAKPPRRDPDRGVTPRYITEESPRNAGLASSKPACQLFRVLSEIEFLDHTSSEATSRCRSSSAAHASRSQASRSSTGCRTASWNSDSICCHRFNLPPGFYTPDVRRHPIRGGLVLGIELYEIIAKSLSFDRPTQAASALASAGADPRRGIHAAALPSHPTADSVGRETGVPGVYLRSPVPEHSPPAESACTRAPERGFAGFQEHSARPPRCAPSKESARSAGFRRDGSSALGRN